MKTKITMSLYHKTRLAVSKAMERAGASPDIVQELEDLDLECGQYFNIFWQEWEVYENDSEDCKENERLDILICTMEEVVSTILHDSKQQDIEEMAQTYLNEELEALK